MSPTRLLILSATAFALGLPLEGVVAQQAGDQDAAQDGRSWQTNRRRSSNARSGAGLIRVVQNTTITSSNNPPQQQPSAGPGLSQAQQQSQAANRPRGGARVVNSIALPPNERRVGPARFTNRASLRTPDDFSALVSDEFGRVTVSWNDNNAIETSYVVQRRTATSGGWGEIEERIVPANTIEVLDEPDAGQHVYRVAAARSAGRSWFSPWKGVIVDPLAVAARQAQEPDPAPEPEPQPQAPVGGNQPQQPQQPAPQPGQGGTPTPPPLPPAIPGQLAATDAGARTARVTWGIPQGAATGVQIERSPAFSEGVRTLPGTAREFVDQCGAGEFEYRVRAVGPGGSSEFTGWIGVDVSDIVPLMPDNFVVTDLADHSRVRINWRDNADNEIRFRLERQTRTGGEWGESEFVAVPANSTQQIDAPGPGDHRYRISAVGDAGMSAQTPWMGVSVAAPDAPTPDDPPQAPAAPTGMSASDNGARGAVVSWADASGNETGFDIERDPAMPEGRLRMPAGQTSWTDNAGPGEFQYRVRAVNAAGASPWTEWTAVAIADLAPDAPTGLQVRDFGDNFAAEVEWEDNSSNETGFRIERQTMGAGGWGPTRVVLTPGGRTLQFDGPGPGQHRYRVAAHNDAGVSGYTPWQMLTISQPPVDPGAIPPTPPSLIAATDQGRRASVIWTDTSSNEQGFELERDPAFGSRVLLGANTTGYIDQCGPGDFRYRTRAYNGAGYSPWTEWAGVQVAETPPAGPSGLHGLDAGDQRHVTLSWTDNAGNEQAYRVARERWSSNAWSSDELITLGANTTAHTDDPGLGRFRYRVQAVNEGGESAWSDWATINVTDGWTTIVRSPDTREIFVSASAGVDTNTGLAENQPVRTMFRAAQLARNGMPDHVRFKRGDVWSGDISAPEYDVWNKSGRSASEPIVLHTYGDAEARPVLQSGGRDKCFQVMGDGVGNIWIVGLHFQADRRLPGVYNAATDPGGMGIRWYGRNGGNVLIEDCYFEAFSTNLSFESSTTDASPGAPAENWMRNVTIRRSVIVDAFAKTGSHSQGAYFSMVDGILIDECVVDHNGWSEVIPGKHSTIYNHNFYVQPNCDNVVIRNSITARASATGIQMRGRDMVAFNNLSLKNPLGITAGHTLAQPYEGWTGAIRSNVVLDAADIGVQGGDFRPRGFGTIFGRSVSGVIEGNIYAHNVSAVGNEPAIQTEMPSEDITIRNNIIYNWRGTADPQNPTKGMALRLDCPLPGGAEVRDNTVVQALGGRVVGMNQTNPGGAWSGNDWWSAGSIDSQWFIQGATSPFNYPSWVQRSGEVNGSNTRATFPNANRTIATYMQERAPSYAPTLESFLAEARRQSRRNWRPEFTAAAVNQYIREGFGMPEPGSGGQ
ncbi:MAG TPA: hypothetical protein VD971_00825 [Phycisphaerales bacterium]|nr:hypothetical protein [Phycisphaerales bacterium]